MNLSLGLQQGKLFSLPPKGPVTIHQRALLWFWLTALVLYFGRLFVRYFGPFGVKNHIPGKRGVSGKEMALILLSK